MSLSGRWLGVAATPARRAPGIGCAHVDRRTKNLVKRLRRGGVAVISHPDLDSVAARALVACGPTFVVNACQSITGRYPNAGPAILLDAGIEILDNVGEEVFDCVREGDRLRLDGEVLLRDGVPVARGELLTRDAIRAALAVGKQNVAMELSRFAENTLARLPEEIPGLLSPVALPEVSVRVEGRPVLVVVRGEGYEDDLGRVQPFIQEMRPVLIGVDGGADALLEFGLRPHLILGDMDSVSDAALQCGAELVVHAYPDGRAPGLARLKELGLDAQKFPVPGTSEDAAMLLAYEMGAEVIVAVGTHFSMVEFLDKGRAGMASTFLVRLRVGSILVDAKGVSRLYRPSVRARHIGLLCAAAALPAATVVFLSPRLNASLHTALLTLRVWHWMLFHGHR